EAITTAHGGNLRTPLVRPLTTQRRVHRGTYRLVPLTFPGTGHLVRVHRSATSDGRVSGQHTGRVPADHVVCRLVARVHCGGGLSEGSVPADLTFRQTLRLGRAPAHPMRSHDHGSLVVLHRTVPGTRTAHTGPVAVLQTGRVRDALDGRCVHTGRVVHLDRLGTLPLAAFGLARLLTLPLVRGRVVRGRVVRRTVKGGHHGVRAAHDHVLDGRPVL